MRSTNPGVMLSQSRFDDQLKSIGLLADTDEAEFNPHSGTARPWRRHDTGHSPDHRQKGSAADFPVAEAIKGTRA